MKLGWPFGRAGNNAPTPALGVVRSARLKTPPAPARLTPAVGTPKPQSGEHSRFDAILNILKMPGDQRQNGWKAITGFHALLKDRPSFPNLEHEIVVRTVGLYRTTNYLRERLRGPVAEEDLLMVERNVNEFIALAASPVLKLPAELKLRLDEDLPFAHFLVAVFALARGRYDEAFFHFARASVSDLRQRYDNWEADLGKLCSTIHDGNLGQAAVILGGSFRRLKSELPAVSAVRPAPVLERTVPVHLTPLPQPVEPAAPADDFADDQPTKKNPAPQLTSRQPAVVPQTAYVLGGDRLGNNRRETIPGLKPRTPSPDLPLRRK